MLGPRLELGPRCREGILSPSRLPVSPPELRAGNGTRTRDPNLGKVVLYQLSYSRMQGNLCQWPSPFKHARNRLVFSDCLLTYRI